MCDTLVALGNATEDGSVIFGKNSDRPDDEVQLITHVPRMKFSKGDKLKCTYIKIPQVTETAAVLLSQPWWMWGAEMGANEYGVVIGNEAVHTHEPLQRVGLLGMDLLRLGLERGKTAKESLDTITTLLEEFGQGGGCAYRDSGWMYHNSFIIADAKEAYVLETADKWWIVEKVKSVRSISNGISIRGKGDIRREGIIQHATEQNYCKDDDDFDFVFAFSGSPRYESPYSRGGKSKLLLETYEKDITPSLMMDFLREHEAGICMHGGFESTGSQVSHIRKEKQSIHWFTGTTLPCVSIYKPYIFPHESQYVWDPGPYSKIDKEWLWVQHQASLGTKSKEYLIEIRNFEESLTSEVAKLIENEENIGADEFNKEIRKLNLMAWDKTQELLQ